MSALPPLWSRIACASLGLRGSMAICPARVQGEGPRLAVSLGWTGGLFLPEGTASNLDRPACVFGWALAQYVAPGPFFNTEGVGAVPAVNGWGD